MAPCRLLQALLLVAAFSSQAAGALLPHGPGVLLQHVGRVTHASLAGRRAYVATASNVVACLTQRTGEIEWRRVLDADDVLDDAVFAAGATLTLSSGRRLRAWSHADGALAWEEELAGPGHAAAPVLLLLSDSQHEAVATLAAGRVQLRDAAKGSLLWEVDASAAAGQATLSSLLLSPDGATLYAAGHTSAGAAVAVALRRSSGEVVSHGVATSPRGLLLPLLPLASAAAGPALLVSLSGTGSSLDFVDLAALSSGAASLEMRSVGISGPTGLLPDLPGSAAVRLRSAAAGMVALATDQGLAHGVLAAGAAGAPVVLASWPAGAVVGVPSRMDSGSLVLPAVSGAPGAASLSVISLSSTAAVHAEPLPATNSSRVLSLFAGATVRRNGSLAYRYLVVGADHSATLMHGGAAVWTRQEALADIRTVVSLDGRQPASHAFATLTGAGSVFLLDAQTGAALWVWTPAPGQRPARTMLLWRAGASPMLLLVGDSASGGTALTWLDGTSGAMAGSAEQPLQAVRVVATHAPLADGCTALLLWEVSSGAVSVFPATAEAASLAASVAPSLRLYAIDGPAGVVRGYSVASAGAGLRALPTWSVVTQGPVLSSAARSREDVVFSRTRIRGDRSTALKHLAPSAVLVVSAAPPASAEADAGALEVAVLDAATGRFLYRVRHAGASGPVTATAADNWFVYAYSSDAVRRTELSVLELFEEEPRGGGRSLGVTIRAALGAGVPAASPSAGVRVLGQSYALGAPLSVLGATVTRRGLASRHVLLGTRAGRVVALDRRFVDPRRPLRPSAADREEGLMPYQEPLPLLPGAHVSGAGRVARLHTLGAAPAPLESATHVLAAGLDLLLAAAAPSATFDTLGAGFSRVALAATVTVLAVAATAAGWAAHRDDLARRWL